MWSIVVSAAVGALGILWGSKHPVEPFQELYDTVKGSLDVFKRKKNNNKENPNDKQNS